MAKGGKGNCWKLLEWRNISKLAGASGLWAGWNEGAALVIGGQRSAGEAILNAE